MLAIGPTSNGAAGDDRPQARGDRCLPRSTDHPITRRRPTTTSYGRSCAAPRRQLGVAQPQKTALELDALLSVILKHPGGSARAARSGAAAHRVRRGAAPQRARRARRRRRPLRGGRGVVLRLRRSKSNQEGALEEVAVLYGSDPHHLPSARAPNVALD
jgi:hypothetical protein